MIGSVPTMPTRLFLSQTVLDRWLSDGTADVSGDTLTILAADHKFDLKTAVLFEKEVTESGDKHTLLGKVKDLEQIAELGGDYSAGTVIVGDEAYEVTDGFAGVAVQGDLLPALASLAPPRALDGPHHRSRSRDGGGHDRAELRRGHGTGGDVAGLDGGRHDSRGHDGGRHDGGRHHTVAGLHGAG
jgi:hypothetical protein